MEENESIEDQIQKPPSLRKEPSFSRWCGDEQQQQQEREPSTSDEDESDDFDLPLLRSESDKANSESESPRSSEFRQRSMHLNNSASLAHLVMNGNGKAYVPLDIENGLHTSESMEKLDSLASSSPMSSSSSSLSAAMVLKTLFFILVWYTFSTLLTLYNKTLLGDHLGKFPVPLMMNTVHFGMQAMLSNAIVFFQSRCCERSRGPTMTWRDYFFRVVPTALGTALDINLSNASLVFISVTFATMCKSASPIFLLMFAFAFRLESPSIKLLGIILVISFGVLLTGVAANRLFTGWLLMLLLVAKETEFEFWGFLFVMLAAVMSGFRWGMTQILLQKETYGLKNPITLMSYVTPVMTVTTAIFSLMLDPWHNLSKNKYFDNSSHIIQSCLLMLLGGALAFFMVLTEYVLVSATSAVTVTIAGIVKEAVTILAAVYFFHDQFTLLKGIGLFTIIVGVSLFNWYKYQKLNKGGPRENGEMNSTFNGAAKYVILDEDIPFDVDIIDSNT